MKVVNPKQTKRKINELIQLSKEDPTHIPELIKEFVGAEIYYETSEREAIEHHLEELLMNNEDKLPIVPPSLKLLNGGRLLLKGQFDRSNELLLAGAKEFEALNQAELKNLCENFIGINYRSTGEIDKAIQCFEELVKADISDDSPVIICKEIGFYQLGELYTDIKEYQTAEKYYKKALHLTEQRKNHIMRVRTINGLGNLYRSNDQSKKGVQLLEEALSICQQELGRKILEVRLLNDLASSYKEEGKHRKAFQYAKRSLQMAEGKLGDGPVTTSLMLVGETALEMNDIEAAKKHLERALKLANKINAKPKVARISKTLSSVYDNIGDQKKALQHFVDYHELQTNFFNEKENKIFRAKNAEINKQKQLIERIHEELKDSIHYAKVLQETMLPSVESIRKNLPNTFVLYRPRDIVSGDFFWFSRVPDNGADKYVLAAVDCTGHGVPGAFISIKGEALLQQIVHGQGITQPAEILNHLHHSVKEALTIDEEHQNDGMDLSLCVIAPQKRTLTFAGAKNPLFMVQNNSLKEFKGSPYAIGDRFSPDVRFEQKEIKVGDQAMFYIFSDGYQDQFGGPKGKKFMKKPFKRLLEQISDHSPEDQKALLVKQLEEWRNYHPHNPQDQVDDILVIGFRL